MLELSVHDAVDYPGTTAAAKAASNQMQRSRRSSAAFCSTLAQKASTAWPQVYTDDG